MATQTMIYNINYDYSVTPDSYLNGLQVRYNCTSVGDEATNKSTLTIKVQVNASSGLSSLVLHQGSTNPDSPYGYEVSNIYVNGVKYEYYLNTGEAIKTGTWATIATINVNEKFTHNVSGQKSINVSGKLYFGYETNIGYRLQVFNQSSKALSLVQINRVSTITCSTAYINESAKISIAKPSNDFTNTLTYKFYNLTGTIATKTSSTSLDWIIPEAFYNEIPNASSGQGTITVQTYTSSGTSTGTKNISFTVLVKEDNCKPQINNPTVKDINTNTILLTGDENKLIKYESIVEYSFQAVAQNGATIIDQFIQNGNNKVVGLMQGNIDNIESGLFTFNATDSRGFTGIATVEKPIIEYVKPTCYQNVNAELDGEVGANIKLIISGNYYNGSFGIVDNELKLEVRHTQSDGNMGDWVDLTNSHIPVFYDNNTYELEITMNGFDYRQAYIFQCRATDKIHCIQSSQYTVRVLPVFDWSEDEVNFNVPVSINNEIVLRHNAEDNNTILSAFDGNIYIRPGGTNSTYGETVFYPDGSVNFNGEIKINGQPFFNINNYLGDYIIETGTEAMGSNGTWYWEKWASGKAVCWGCKDFGEMQITTASGSLYKSQYQYSQELPSGLFITNPEVINMEMHDYHDGGTEYCAIMRSGGFNSKTTINFQPFLTKSLTIYYSYVGFHVIGRWK